MEERAPAGLTAAEGRGFAIPVGTVFAMLAGVAWWREHDVLMTILGGLGILLLVAGVTIPRHLGPVYRGWILFAQAVSRVTTPLFMAVVYYGVMVPVGLFRRAVIGNPMKHEEDGGTYYRGRKPGARRSDLKRQF